MTFCYLNNFAQDHSKPDLQGISFLFQETMTFLCTSQTALNQHLSTEIRRNFNRYWTTKSNPTHTNKPFFEAIFRSCKNTLTNITYPRDGKIANLSFPDILYGNYLRFIPNLGFFSSQS